jgi:hypothetical protein
MVRIEKGNPNKKIFLKSRQKGELQTKLSKFLKLGKFERTVELEVPLLSYAVLVKVELLK